MYSNFDSAWQPARLRSLLFAGIAALSCAAAGSAQARVTLVPPAESVCRHCVPPVAIQAPAPPAGFNPLTASDDELAFYGYPPRPDSRTALASYDFWRKVVTLPVRRLHTTFQATTIYNGPAKIRSIGPHQPGTAATGVESYNWSGYADAFGLKYPFWVANTTIYGAFVVPVAQQAFGACTGGWDYSTQWVGIDGWISQDVFQAGIEADAYCSGGSTSQSYSAWYEWYPNYETEISGFSVNAGDVIYLYIWPTSRTTGEYYITDQTANTAVQGSFSAPEGTELLGDSVEWVVERPTVNGAFATLTNYGDVPWYDAQAVVPGKNNTSTEYSPGQGHAGTIFSVTMLDNNGNGISDAYTSGNDLLGLTYVNPSGTKAYYSGTALWFQDFGSAF